MRVFPHQYSLEEAMEEANIAIAQGEMNAQEFWRAEAHQAIRRCAAAHGNFLVDDVWIYMPLWAHTQDKRAMGAAMRRAVAAGVIAKTSEYRPSAQVQCHGNLRAVWRSRL